MRTFSKLLVATAALANFAAAADVSGLLNELTSLNLTSLVGAATKIANTTAGARILGALGSSSGFYTVLAPNNAAFAGVNPFFANDPTWLGQAFAYHIIPGSVQISDISVSPQVSVHPTLLNDSSIVHLYGGKAQNIGLQQVDNQTLITNQNNVPCRIVKTVTYQNILIHVVSTVIDLPPTPKDAFTSSQYTWTSNLTSLVQFSPANISEAIFTSPSLTVFAPNNQALVDAVQFGHIPANISGEPLNALIENHVINGTVVFTGSSQTTYTSAGGEEITIGLGGAFGNVVYYKGQLVANIVYPDIIMQNGVIHIIDAVLPNTNEDPKAASSAFSVATKSATATQTQGARRRADSRFFRF